MNLAGFKNMIDFLKGKVVTALIVIATVILAGVAIFTALRLYQLRKESVSLTSPESQLQAWDCSKYTFALDANGVVTVTNSSSQNEPPQEAKVYIDETLIATFDVPALSPGQKGTLGTVQIPTSEFSWKIIGTKDCQNSGSSSSKKSCELLTFTISKVTPTPTSISTPTPTERPIGGNSPTPTPTEAPASTSTPTPTTGGGVSAASPTPGGAALPGAGIAFPTIIGLTLGILLLLGAVLLAI